MPADVLAAFIGQHMLEHATMEVAQADWVLSHPGWDGIGRWGTPAGLFRSPAGG